MIFEKSKIILIVILIPAGFFFWYTTSMNVSFYELFTPATKVMHIGSIPVRVDIANSEEERILGYSGKDGVGKMNGLLFVFPDTGYHGMWMKDMNFLIDIIWISEDLTVVGIERNVSPNTYPKTFRPPVPVKYVLETEGMFTDVVGIGAGQKVVLPNKYLED